MASPGYVYALINPSMPGLVKVGRTGRNPTDRASELSGATGVPTPFVVVYHECFADCEEAEAFVHLMLQRQGYRLSNAREFFNAEIADVIKTIVGCPGKVAASELSSISGDLNLEEQGPSLVETLLTQARSFLYGRDGELQDYNEAMRLFRQAAQLGSGDAWDSIGHMYSMGYGSQKNNGAALEAYKEAIKSGYIRGYVGMASIFADEKHEMNFRKCWDKFFSEYGASGCSYTPGDLYGMFFWYCYAGWSIQDVPPVCSRYRTVIRNHARAQLSARPESNLFTQADTLITRLLFPEEATPSWEDMQYNQAVALVCREGKASTSFVQRSLQFGYNTAAAMIQRMEAEGIVSQPNHDGVREVLGGSGDKDLYDQAVALVAGEERVSTGGLQIQFQRRFEIGSDRAARLISAMEANGVITLADNAGERKVLFGQVGQGTAVAVGQSENVVAQQEAFGSVDQSCRPEVPDGAVLGQERSLWGRLWNR